MSLKIYGKAFLMVISLAFISKYIYSYYTSNKKRGKHKEIHEAIFFSTDDRVEKKCKHSNYFMTDSLSKLCYYLNTTQETVDLCMYVFTNKDFYHVLLKLYYKGIRLRLILDADMAFSTGSMAKKFEKAGVPLRWRKSANLMHHKFCLIDAASTESTPLLMTGSLNWTNQALYGNWEGVVVTSQTQLVQSYREYFNILWEQFKPIV